MPNGNWECILLCTIIHNVVLVVHYGHAPSCMRCTMVYHRALGIMQNGTLVMHTHRTLMTRWCIGVVQQLCAVKNPPEQWPALLSIGCTMAVGYAMAGDDDEMVTPFSSRCF